VHGVESEQKPGEAGCGGDDAGDGGMAQNGAGDSGKASVDWSEGISTHART